MFPSCKYPHWKVLESILYWTDEDHSCKYKYCGNPSIGIIEQGCVSLLGYRELPLSEGDDDWGDEELFFQCGAVMRWVDRQHRGRGWNGAYCADCNYWWDAHILWWELWSVFCCEHVNTDIAENKDVIADPCLGMLITSFLEIPEQSSSRKNRW